MLQHLLFRGIRGIGAAVCTVQPKHFSTGWKKLSLLMHNSEAWVKLVEKAQQHQVCCSYLSKGALPKSWTFFFLTSRGHDQPCHYASWSSKKQLGSHILNMGERERYQKSASAIKAQLLICSVKVLGFWSFIWSTAISCKLGKVTSLLHAFAFPPAKHLESCCLSPTAI